MKTGQKVKKTSRSPTDIDRSVGENIRRFRCDRNLTLAELAEALGISHQQLQKYETGTNRISAGMISNVADILAVQIDDLFQMPARMKAKARRSETEEINKLRQQCLFIVERTTSVDTLKKMANVLKALSAAP